MPLRRRQAYQTWSTGGGGSDLIGPHRLEGMADQRKAYYVTTPIYYVNDVPHIGHAYTTVAGDVLARWHRQRGEDVWFLTGTDEHGQKILRSGRGATASPRRSGPTSSSRPRGSRCSTTIDVANDDFIRTTEERHSERVQEFLQTLYDAGDIYEGEYEGPYCVGCEEFKLPSELLDGDGDYAGQALRDPRPPGRDPQEKNYFFRLSSVRRPAARPLRGAPRLRAARERPQRGPRRSSGRACRTSRSRGRRSTGASRCRGTTTHVVYVWFDALLNYVTAVGYGDRPASSSPGAGPPTSTSSARTSCASTPSSGRRC